MEIAQSKGFIGVPDPGYKDKQWVIQGPAWYQTTRGRRRARQAVWSETTGLYQREKASVRRECVCAGNSLCVIGKEWSMRKEAPIEQMAESQVHTIGNCKLARTERENLSFKRHDLKKLIIF